MKTDITIKFINPKGPEEVKKPLDQVYELLKEQLLLDKWIFINGVETNKEHLHENNINSDDYIVVINKLAGG